MKNLNVSCWVLRGFLVAAVVSWSGFTAAAEPEVKKESAPAVAASQAVVAPPAVVVPPGPVARVNGTAIDAVELRRVIKVMMRGQEVPADQKAAIEKQAVEQLVSAELLYQDAAKLEVKDLDKKVEASFAQGKARFKDEQEFKNTIKDMEMEEKDLREYTRRELLISNFVDVTFVPKVFVPEAEVRSFYDKNIDKFKLPETVKASHILIGIDSKTSVEEKKKAQEKAEKLRKELTGGADFAVLAKDNSTCPSSQQGGDLGFFGRGQMVEPFEKAAFALKPGEISAVVETQFGFHIIKLVEKKTTETTDYKDVKEKIEGYLKGQKVNEGVQQYIAEAKKTAKIEVLLK